MAICTLYKAIIIPHLEYGNAIWCPFYQKDIEKGRSDSENSDEVDQLIERQNMYKEKKKDKTYEDEENWNFRHLFTCGGEVTLNRAFIWDFEGARIFHKTSLLFI